MAATQIRKSQFVIEPEEAESMRERLNLPSLRDLLPELLPAAAKLARPAISGFRVGAAALGSSGRIYLGANIEFPNLPLHHSIHAEQFLVANAASHAEPAIRSVAVSEFPCGHCRQFLQEIRSAARIQILVAAGEFEFRPLEYFLPNPFGPSDLLRGDVPLLLEPHCNDLIEMEDGGGVRGGLEERMREAAARAANAAHAPYSGSASGFAVADEEGVVYAGSYAESCAYNPSLGPVQAAVVAYLVGGGGGGGGGGDFGGRIVAGVLAEREGAAVKQEETARILFEAVAPKAKFTVCRLSAGAA